MSGSTTFSFLLYIPLHEIHHFNFPGIIIEEESSFRSLHSPSLLVDIFTIFIPILFQAGLEERIQIFRYLYSLNTHSKIQQLIILFMLIQAI